MVSEFRRLEPCLVGQMLCEQHEPEENNCVELSLVPLVGQIS